MPLLLTISFSKPSILPLLLSRRCRILFVSNDAQNLSLSVSEPCLSEQMHSVRVNVTQTTGEAQELEHQSLSPGPERQEEPSKREHVLRREQKSMHRVTGHKLLSNEHSAFRDTRPFLETSPGPRRVPCWSDKLRGSDELATGPALLLPEVRDAARKPCHLHRPYLVCLCQEKPTS